MMDAHIIQAVCIDGAVCFSGLTVLLLNDLAFTVFGMFALWYIRGGR